MVMMESSTIIPSTTIRPASVTVFSPIPVRYMTARAIAVHTGTPELAISAERIGESMSITRITTNIEISRSLRKENTEFLTSFGWSVMRVSVTLSGMSCSNSARTLSSFLPKATMSLSERISTEMIRAELPL